MMQPEERTCTKEICRKVWEEKYVPAEDVEGFTEDCGTTGKNYKKVKSQWSEL